MTCKLHINISQGLIEAEGSEEFVSQVYQDFKGSLINSRLPKSLEKDLPANDLLPDNTAVEPDNKKTITKPKTKKPATAKGYSLNKDLNLYAEGKKEGLKEFISKYKAKNSASYILLFANYLKNVKDMEEVGVKDIYTCYKHIGIKVPNIEQSINNCFARQGWLNSCSSDAISISRVGENAITHELLIKEDE